MAVTKIWAVKCRIEDAIDYTTNEEKTINPEYNNEDKKTKLKEEYDDYYNSDDPNIYNDFDTSFDYATNPEKTEEQYFVTAINCSKDIAKEEMRITKKQYNKIGGILAFHLIQSFKEGEVSKDVAHEIGVRLAEEVFGDRFEVVVSTHLNTKCYHNHFIINSVSFADGMKYYDNHTTYAHIREVSDNLCREYGLSTIKEKKTKKTNLDYSKFQNKYINTPYYKTTKADIDKAIKQAYTYDDFEELLEKMNYTLTYRADKLSVCRDGYKRNIRIERAFGENYSIENIGRRILEENETRIPFIEDYRPKRYYCKTKLYKLTKINKKYRTSLYRLYLYYRYKLNRYKRLESPERWTPEKRKEIEQMDKYSMQAKFLASKKIHTSEELSLYKESLKVELDNLESEYQKILKKRKHTLSKQEILDRRKILNEEVEICKSIEERIPKIKEELRPKDKDNEERKERLQDERIR